MDSINRIFGLMKLNDISQAKLQKELGLSGGLLTQWKQGKQKPSTEAIIKIAEYFKVSTDYLLGLTDNPMSMETVEILSSQQVKLPNAYLKFAKQAQDLKMSEKDMQTLLDFFKRAQKHDR